MAANDSFHRAAALLWVTFEEAGSGSSDAQTSAVKAYTGCLEYRQMASATKAGEMQVADMT